MGPAIAAFGTEGYLMPPAHAKGVLKPDPGARCRARWLDEGARQAFAPCKGGQEEAVVDQIMEIKDLIYVDVKRDMIRIMEKNANGIILLAAVNPVF